MKWLKVKVPRKKPDKRICDLRDGEHAWIIPWAFKIDKDGDLCIDEHHDLGDFYKEKGGTLEAKIVKRKDGIWLAQESVGIVCRRMQECYGKTPNQMSSSNTTWRPCPQKVFCCRRCGCCS